MNSVTKLILAWTMYVTPTVHPTARITPLFYCQIQQVKSQEVKLSFEKNARVVGLQVFFYICAFCFAVGFSVAMGKDNIFLGSLR